MADNYDTGNYPLEDNFEETADGTYDEQLEQESLEQTEEQALAEARAYEEELDREARARARMIRAKGQYYAL